MLGDWVILLKLLSRRLNRDGNIEVLLLSIAICLFADSIVAQVNFVYGLGCRVVNPCLHGSFGNVQSFLVNQVNEFLSLGVWDWFVLFPHLVLVVLMNYS